jgi:hypothetical protein
MSVCRQLVQVDVRQRQLELHVQGKVVYRGPQGKFISIITCFARFSPVKRGNLPPMILEPEEAVFATFAGLPTLPIFAEASRFFMLISVSMVFFQTYDFSASLI